MDSGDTFLELENVYFNRGIEGLKAEIDRRVYGNSKLRSTISSVRTFDQVMAGTEIRNTVEEDLRDSVPDEVYLDTAGEYLYGCFYPQDDVAPECTPPCINGFQNTQLLTCNFPVLEVTDDGEIIKHNKYTGERAYVFTQDGTLSPEVAQEISNRYGISRVDVFIRDSETIKYSYIDSQDLADIPLPEPSLEVDSKPQDYRLARGVLVAVIVAVIVIVGVSYTLKD